MNVKLVHSWGLLRGKGSIDFLIVSELVQLLDELRNGGMSNLLLPFLHASMSFSAERPEFLFVPGAEGVWYHDRRNPTSCSNICSNPASR
jgi:hypothetical protein